MSRVVQIAAAGVRVVFTPAGDLFTQRIELGDAVVLDSVDAAEGFSQAWPACPPLQEVHFEQRPAGRQVALMIGRAGTSHWSISCELNPAAGELMFDVACRIKQPAAWLGSTYQLAPGVVFVGDAADGELQCGKITLCRVTVKEDCGVTWQSESGRLVFEPRLLSETDSQLGAKFPRTIRWRYNLFVKPMEA